jgi:hypothetical protein
VLGMARIEKSVEWAIEEFKRNDVKTVICLGDILNTRQVVSVGSLSAAMNFFDRLTTNFDNVHVILGSKWQYRSVCITSDADLKMQAIMICI